MGYSKTFFIPEAKGLNIGNGVCDCEVHVCVCACLGIQTGDLHV